jgi:hypothetical protein
MFVRIWPVLKNVERCDVFPPVTDAVPMFGEFTEGLSAADRERLAHELKESMEAAEETLRY